MKNSIEPGAVYLRNHQWTYVYYVDGNKVSCPNTFKSSLAAKTAMMQLIKKETINGMFN